MLKGLQAEGLTVLMVTHDVEFAAENADFSRQNFTLPGGIVSENGMARFWPQRHGTDGFFAAVLRREK